MVSFVRFVPQVGHAMLQCFISAHARIQPCWTPWCMIRLQCTVSSQIHVNVSTSTMAIVNLTFCNRLGPSKVKQCIVNQISIQLRSLHVTSWMFALAQLVPQKIWAHCVAQIDSIKYNYISSKRSHMQLTWILHGLTDKLDGPDPWLWPTFGYTTVSYTMQLRAAYLKTEMKWRTERQMTPLFSFSH